MRKRLVCWIICEALIILFCVFMITGCTLGAHYIFTHMLIDNPILFILQGIGGLFVALFGIGFILAMVLVILLGVEINRELLYEIELEKIEKTK